MRTLTLLVVICLLALSTSAFAQTRTTPVQVENSPTVKIDTTTNTVKVDGTANTVKSQQSGAWTVGVSGTPNVSVVNSPDVNVANAPTVKIDSVDNVVATPTQSHGVKLFTTTSPVLAAGAQLFSASFNCAGYREVRVVIKFNTAAPLDQFRIFPEYDSNPAGSTFTPGYVTGQTPTEPMIKHATFVQSGGVCMFTVPVLSDVLSFLLQNASTSNVTIDSARSWAWLIN